MPGHEALMKYDAIIIGGGHNGLVNGAYLAKAGLKTLILEKRPFVGGAAITEELLPGYHFTTFSYAISLIRPDIVEDLQLVKHGMMVLPFSRSFQPGYNGEYLLMGHDKDENFHRIERSYGAFERYFTLPDTINVQNITATFKDGVLTLTLPKHKKLTPHKIKISVES